MLAARISSGAFVPTRIICPIFIWDHFRESALLDDAERIVRCRLIPAQVREPMPVKPRRDEPRDCFRNLPQRFVGAIGGNVGHVKGQSCVTDFTASALHSLIELYRRTVDVEEDAVRMNFHFDREQADISVHCARDGAERRVEVRNGTGKDLLIRAPGWAPEASLHLIVGVDPCGQYLAPFPKRCVSFLDEH